MHSPKRIWIGTAVTVLCVLGASSFNKTKIPMSDTFEFGIFLSKEAVLGPLRRSFMSDFRGAQMTSTETATDNMTATDNTTATSSTYDASEEAAEENAEDEESGTAEFKKVENPTNEIVETPMPILEQTESQSVSTEGTAKSEKQVNLMTKEPKIPPGVKNGASDGEEDEDSRSACPDGFCYLASIDILNGRFKPEVSWEYWLEPAELSIKLNVSFNGICPKNPETETQNSCITSLLMHLVVLIRTEFEICLVDTEVNIFDAQFFSSGDEIHKKGSPESKAVISSATETWIPVLKRKLLEEIEMEDFCENWLPSDYYLIDIPLHVSTLTLLLIAWDRHRFLKDPMKPRIPAFVCATGSWLTAICLVLPYPIYTTYIDLGKYLQQFQGVGICVVNLQDDMQEYLRGLFIALYVLPLSVTAYLFVRMSRELQEAEGPLPVMVYDGVRARTSTGSHDFRKEDGQRLRTGSNNHHDIYEAELDVRKEKRSHRYLGTIASIFAICLCPLMVLRVAKLALTETYDNSGHFDITYTMFVWIAFLPTTTTPALYAAWRMSRTTKERLRGYFRFSGRARSTNTDTRSERSEPPPPLTRNAYTSTPRSSEAGLSNTSNFNNS